MLDKLSSKNLKNRQNTSLVCILFIMVFLGLLACMFLSVTFGAKEVKLHTVWSAIFHYNSALTPQQIIHELRLPRMIGAAIVGAAFAVAGALIQGITRNPLADAGILGINGGSMFVVALCFAFFPGLPYSLLMVFSFIGAVLSTLFIFAIGSASPGGLTPIRLTISGAVIRSPFTFTYFRCGNLLRFESGLGLLVCRRSSRYKVDLFTYISACYFTCNYFKSFSRTIYISYYNGRGYCS